jgi:hypothetical protein
VWGVPVPQSLLLLLLFLLRLLCLLLPAALLLLLLRPSPLQCVPGRVTMIWHGLPAASTGTAASHAEGRPYPIIVVRERERAPEQDQQGELQASSTRTWAVCGGRWQ